MKSALSDGTTESQRDLDDIFEEIKTRDFASEADILKALGHPVRLKIVYGLLRVGGCNVKNMQECLGLHQATVSQHLIHLKNRGIIDSTRQGLQMIYGVVNPLAQRIIEAIETNEEDGSPDL